MRKETLLVLLIMCVVLALTAIPALAEDGKNLIDQISDAITGHNDYVKTFGSYELCKELPTESIPVLNMLPFGINKGRTQIGGEIKMRFGDKFMEESEYTWRVRNIF